MALIPLSRDAEKAVLQILEDLATPRSLKVYILWKHGEWDQIASLELDPWDYLSPESYWADAQAFSLVRKLETMPTTFNREVRAIDTFFQCERDCLVANRRLYPLIPGSLSSDLLGGDVHEFFSRARKIIADILGPCPDIVDGRFGPGATYGDRGRLTTVPDKMTSEPTFTREAWPFLVPWSGTQWAKAYASSRRSIPKPVRGNRFTTVPKDATKFRGIAIEPSINLFYQLAYGKEIRRRLRRWGINLNEGQDIHRRLACEASTHGHLATLDLSNASDTVSRNLVKSLLPSRWFEVLDDLRSKRTLVNGDWILLEKFSSMGNGFTFELETLIFLGLMGAVCGADSIGKTVFAFGDDLIMPTEFSDDVVSALSFSGLTVNRAKSFVNGPFRESCGGDYFLGVNVRPFFLKDSPDEPQQLIAFANGLRRSADQHCARDYMVYRGWLSVLEGIPSSIRKLRGPKELGDLVIHDERERWQVRRRNGIRYVRVYRPTRFKAVSWRYFREDVILASALYGIPVGGRKPIGSPEMAAPRNEGVTPRDAVAGYKIGWVAHS